MSERIRHKASELGYRNIWTGAFAPPTGITFWPDDDVEEYLAWGRMALGAEILYIDEFQIEVEDSEDSREITICFFMAAGICHAWASEAALRSLRGDVDALIQDLEESGDYEEVDYDAVRSQVLEYVDQVASSDEFINALSDPTFYRERGGPPTPFVFRIAGELSALRPDENVDYGRYAGLIADRLGEVMNQHRQDTENWILNHLDDVRNEITKSDKEWTTRLVKMREKTVREYLLKTYGFTSAAIVGEVSRIK